MTSSDFVLQVDLFDQHKDEQKCSDVSGDASGRHAQHASAHISAQRSSMTEADFSDAELASFKAAGQRRGMMRYKLELQAEMDTYGQLKQRRMGGQ